MIYAKSGRSRIAGTVAVAAAMALGVTVGGSGEASSQDIFPKYFFDCGSSRGVSFNVGLIGGSPGEAGVVTGGAGPDSTFVVPTGPFRSIPISPAKSSGHVILAFDVTDPPAIDSRTGVTCNSRP